MDIPFSNDANFDDDGDDALKEKFDSLLKGSSFCER